MYQKRAVVADRELCGLRWHPYSFTFCMNLESTTISHVFTPSSSPRPHCTPWPDLLMRFIRLSENPPDSAGVVELTLRSLSVITAQTKQRQAASVQERNQQLQYENLELRSQNSDLARQLVSRK